MENGNGNGDKMGSRAYAAYERAPSEGYRARAECNNWMVKSTAWKLHQDFKWHFVATFADEWELYDSQIAAWLKEQEEQWQEC
jgi:uncharacterized protein DUF6166